MNECVIVIFGFTGDLARRKLIPSLYRLFKEKKINNFALIGTGLEDTNVEHVFEKAKKLGVRTVYVNTKKDGYIDEKMISENVPDYPNKVFYVSGPEPMVEAVKNLLSEMKIKKIKTDFFPGYTEI